MKYYLFLDESGDHGLKTIDKSFPIFLLCGILISEENYRLIRADINQIKIEFWNNKNVIFHSRDIRKCNNEFQILFDLDIKKKFYNSINSLVEKPLYHIIAAAINKTEFIKKYGKLENDVYEISLSFILERTVFCLDNLGNCNELEIIIERRGKKEDTKLGEHIQKVRQIGTYYVDAERIQNYGFKPKFSWKNENINGLQLSDLIAYPIARKILNPQGVNLSFDKLKHNIYTKNGKVYGLKKFP
ncbi:DUF3800 domain-containing protein [Mariniflexile gromovii]|uniref:DUF3800 domain-containing protein n=1 Tax=Mariniflexile gromovii TaxID=362523 RepID=A0ABS4BQB8_9FLAO|nr:DUF3800 domain-containing protein [Mariniflexile gromovii]MBP0902778.1 DUF3800 domain-containing protein [Mariniflexile gromovii]